MVSMLVKEMLRRLLPPKLTIRLIANTNYKSGEPELKLLKDLVDPTKNSVDIGANKGSYTFFLSQLSKHVYAYEPNPALAKFLSKAVNSSKVSVYPIALSDREGVAKLSIPIMDSFVYDQLGSLQLQNSRGEKIQTFDVPLKRLDDRGHTNVGFVKIDVEGHEEVVIDGAINLIDKQRPILLIEIEQKHHIDKDITAIFSKILALGYEGFFLFDGQLRSLNEFSKDKYQDPKKYQGLASLGKDYVCNFIFKPSYELAKS
jgi:FkbM family methyltransferase